MTLRLTGEEFSVVRGLDGLGHLRSIQPSDTSPGLKVQQSGTGPLLELWDGSTKVLFLDDGGGLACARTVEGTDATDATSTTAAPLKTAGGLAAAKKAFFGDRVTITKGDYLRVPVSAYGPFLAALIGEKGGVPNNTATGVVRVTVPNANGINGTLLMEYTVGTDVYQRFTTGQVRIAVARRGSYDTQRAIAESLAQVSLLTVGDETHTLTWSLSALSGGTTDTQTFDVQFQLNASTGANGQVRYHVRILTQRGAGGYTDEITIAAL